MSSDSDSAPIAATRTILQHPQDHKLWSALRNNHRNVTGGDVIPSINVGGTMIQDPSILGPPDQNNHKSGLAKTPEPQAGSLPIAPPSNGFIVGGEIDVFGLPGVKGFLRSFHGPRPPHIPPSQLRTVYQHVEITQVVIAQLLPSLSMPPFDKLQLNDIRITYQSHQFDTSKSTGWHLEAKITIDQSFGVLHDFLNSMLGLGSDDLTFGVYAFLGVGLSWDKVPSLDTFSLTGTVTVKSSSTVKPPGIKLTDNIILTKIGVTLLGIGTYSTGLGAPFTMNYGFSVFGEMALLLQGNQAPIMFDYRVGEISGNVGFSAILKGGVWKNAFGLNVNLDDVAISAIFPSKDLLHDLEVTFAAYLSAGKLQTSFQGTLSTTGKVNLVATVDSMDFDDIVGFFYHQTGDQLMPSVKAEVTFASASLQISRATSNDKFEWSFNVQNFAYDAYTCESATVTRTLNGVQVSGQIGDQKFGDVKLQSAQMNASFEGTKSSRESDISLSGKVLVPFDNISVDAVVHLFKRGGDSLEWAICCELGVLNQGKPLLLSNAFPILKGSDFENLALEEAAFVITSTNDPELSASISQPFPVTAGKQICAVVENIIPNQNIIPSRLYLSATWDKGFTTDLKLDLLLPSLSIIHFSKKIVTDPISIQLSLEKPFNLAIAAGLHVPVSGNPAPLAFDMKLGIDGGADPTLDLVADMNTEWHDPFGVSAELIIEPPCSIDVKVDLLIFLATGLPSGFGFQGGFLMGSSKVDFAVLVSDDPDQELLKAGVADLAIGDLIAFTGELFEIHFPPIPDFLHFLQADLYISTGVTISNTYYPPGFAMDGTIRLFDKAVFSASVSVLSGHVSVKGSADPFSIGPLTLKGRNGGKATLDLELGGSAQSASIDACITFLGLEVDLFLIMVLSPSPSFTFNFMLKFTDLLLFEVDAQSIGQVSNPQILSGLDFDLHALFEQHILEYIRDQVLKQLEIAKAKVKGAMDDAKAKVSQAEADYQKDIDDAQTKLNTSYASWSTLNNSVHNSSQAVIDKYNADIEKLQGDIETAQQNFTNSMQSVQQKLVAANSDRASKMQAAEAAVNNAKAKWDSDVQNAEAALNNAQQEFTQRFGSAEQDITNAENKVNELQSNINDIQSQIDDYEGASWLEFWKKAAIPGLYIAKGAVEVAKDVADGVLEACNAVVEGAEYATVKGAIPLAEQAVSDVGKAGDTAFQIAQGALQTVDKVTADAVTFAEGAVNLAEKTGNGLIDTAKGALETYKIASDALLKAAQAAIDGLLKSAEYLAYQAASLVLTAAKAATHVIDVAKGALTLVEDAAIDILDLAEDIVSTLAGLLDVTRIELSGQFKEVINGSQPFTVSLDMTILGKNLKDVTLELHMGNTAQLIIDIFEVFIKRPELKKPADGNTPGPVIPPAK